VCPHASPVALLIDQRFVRSEYACVPGESDQFFPDNARHFTFIGDANVMQARNPSAMPADPPHPVIRSGGLPCVPCP
jgi:hypothetical protein